MKSINELKSILDVNLNWNKCRTDCFARMVLSLLLCRSVTLSKLANFFGRTKKVESAHKRITRFFGGFEINYDKIAAMLFRFFVAEGEKVYLLLDRTEWQFGKKWVNILTLAIAYKGIAIPIYWKLLDGRGNSSVASRMELIDKFIKNFGIKSIAGLLCDREFVGKEWFEKLVDVGVIFYARIKKCAVVRFSSGHYTNMWLCCLKRRRGNPRILKKVNAYGCLLGIAGLITPDNDFVIVATNGDPEVALDIYVRRWEIENLFQCLKSRGFCFEETHLKDNAKIEKLLVLLAVGFSWAYKIGMWAHHNARKIATKKHGRKQSSFFRYGLDLIANILLPTRGSYRVFCKYIKLLFSPPNCLFHGTCGGAL